MAAPTGPRTSAEWRALLAGEDVERFIRGRELFRRIPSPPRCKLCLAPFAGPGGAVMRHLGYARWPKSPRFCQACHNTLAKLSAGGAEVEISVLFADMRGSTTLAERMSPTEFGTLINRFYAAVDREIADADGVVDKHLGDGVLGLFIPVWAGRAHAAAAIHAARQIRRAIGQAGAAPWAPVGVGVATGVAFVGVVASGDQPDDFTALGDVVNTAARLSSAAAAGEILVARETARQAGIEAAPDDLLALELKGKGEPVEAVRIGQSGPS
jgi:adenylate cyclase